MIADFTDFENGFHGKEADILSLRKVPPFVFRDL
jgi:hypothetical protein